MINKVINGGITSPLGFMASATCGDIKGNKKGNDDCALLISDTPCQAVGLFTKNIVKAAPVLYDMNILQKATPIKAIFANSGNANACTGSEGLDNCKKIAENYSSALKIKPENFLIASTGVIGVPLPVDKIINIKDSLIDNLSDDNGNLFSKAIMTTDTKAKEIAVCVETPAGMITIGGCAKGAGMIAPSLATMLAFITTDIKADRDMLEKALKECADKSFNQITVDGDMSTNDTVILLANGMSGVPLNNETYECFKAGLLYVMDYFAREIIMDGEGAEHFITIEIKNAKDDNDAKLCASKIANSPLVKTMFAGKDPNWGRLMASAGASGAIFDPDNVDIYFNELHYATKGKILDSALEEEAYKIMEEKEYKITIDLHAGEGQAKFYTCDLTKEYIAINADYRS